MRVCGVVMIILSLLMITSSAGALMASDEIIEVVRNQIKEKALVTGTLDFYDKEKDFVRNLRLLDVHNGPKDEANNHVAEAKFRDLKTGDVVFLDIVINPGSKQVEAMRIAKVEELFAPQKKIKTKVEYNNSDVHQTVKNYINEQTRVSESLMLFDEKSNTMRNLELVELSDDVRQLGIYYTVPATFKDRDTEDMLDVDISLKLEDGELGVQRLRLRKIRE
jgi:hypothetical protein